MKKLIVLSLFAAFAFVSCDSGSESSSTTQTTTTTDTTTVVEESEVEREVTVDTVNTEEDTIQNR